MTIIISKQVCYITLCQKGQYFKEKESGRHSVCRFRSSALVSAAAAVVVLAIVLAIVLAVVLAVVLVAGLVGALVGVLVLAAVVIHGRKPPFPSGTLPVWPGRREAIRKPPEITKKDKK